MDNPQIIKPRRFKIMPVLILALMAAGVIMLISASKDMSTYSTFSQVKRSGDTAKVVGVLAKDKPMYYNAEENPNLFRFYPMQIARKTIFTFDTIPTHAIGISLP